MTTSPSPFHETESYDRQWDPFEDVTPEGAAEAEKVDGQDRKQPAYPWPDSSFFHALREETGLFRAQACFTVDPERRRKEFEEWVRRENIAFRERMPNEALAFELEETKNFYPFTHRLWVGLPLVYASLAC
jgi:hypothetical protein